MYHNGKIFIAKDGDEPLCLLCDKANRHGLIAGATGTGKTITLKVLAESFSDAGVPVFLADVKGDLAGMSRCGTDSEDMQKRIARFGLAECGFNYHAYPTNYWDIFAETGLPLRTTITEMGPVLLAQLLELTPTQEDILNIVYRIADDEGLLLIDSKDLRSMLAYVAENAKEYSNSYGNINKASLNVIQRGMAALETQGANVFFGEPALNIRDWIRQDNTGKGYINILDSRSLINNPKMYAMFLLWLLSELFEVLPEVGDAEKPKLIFFFDEAHLLFSDAPKALLRKIEQVVKLIRSKGVGVYFITQNPADIPDGVLAQLGNKVQHALHAYPPADMKGLKIRIVGTPIFKDIFEALGANPQAINWSEAVTGFQQGIVDGQENPTNGINIPMKLWQYGHKYLTDWHYMIDPLLLTANQKVWKDFSKEDQAILMECAKDAEKYSKALSRLGFDDGSSLAYLQSINKAPAITDPYGECEKNGMTVVKFTPEQVKEFYAATQSVRDKWIKEVGADLVKAAEADMAGK